MIMLRGGKTLSPVTSDPAATMLCDPIVHPFRSVLPMPTRTSSPTVAP